MSIKQTYFSLIQYCPDLARREYANMGVLLFCSDANYLEIKLSEDNARVKRFFGHQIKDWKRFDLVKKGMEYSVKTVDKSLDALTDFIGTRMNSIRFAPLTLLVTPRSLESELDHLYKELVVDV